jgi:hypothetical protein
MGQVAGGVAHGVDIEQYGGGNAPRFKRLFRRLVRAGQEPARFHKGGVRLGHGRHRCDAHRLTHRFASRRLERRLAGLNGRAIANRNTRR